MSQSSADAIITVASIIIVVFSGWLVIMMLWRMWRDAAWSARNLAAVSYPASTCVLFCIVTMRMVFRWPPEVSVVIILFKAVAVVAVTVWARASIDSA